MTVVKGTLFVEGKPPIAVEMEIPNDTPIEQQGGRVALTVGDGVGAGTLLLPIPALTGIMASLMEADRKRAPAIIMPDNKIIVPN